MRLDIGKIAAAALIALAVTTISGIASAQSGALGDFWTPLSARPDAATARSANEQWLALDEVGLERHLAVLPAADSGASLPLILPAPDGEPVSYEVRRSHVMAPALVAKYPHIQTYQGVAADGSGARVRFELGPKGFSAMLFTPKGVTMIERGGSGSEFVSFARGATASPRRFTCDIHDAGTLPRDPDGFAADPDAAPARATGPQLRTYRTAIAATGEYTAVFGGSVIDGLAAVVSATNRVNQIYETDLGLRLELVPNNDLIIYTNGATDPYTNSNGVSMLSQNISNLSTVIGNANFDFGHVFSTGGGGVAGLGVICGGSKARGVTGQGNPQNDPFWVDYVAHEMGHQLNGPHTFNGGTGACSGGNRSAGSAYEPGSGSTIMAYAGICGGENLQGNSDAFFHVDSLRSIHAFTQTGLGSTCGSLSATGNSAPVLTATPDATIPARTPFALTALATDPDGDTLSYLWEQYDLGARTNTTTIFQDLGTGPLFRSFDASVSPTRLFPRLEAILSNTPSIGEVLPTTSRSLNFRVTVRDSRAGGGGVEWTGSTSSGAAQTTLTVVDTGAPFALTSANTATTWVASASETVSWDVAGTTAAPISCANVDLDFSLDAGLNFPVSLAVATANDGSESIVVPDQATSAGRLRVRCSDNIFFDINNAPITVSGGNAAPQLSLSSGTVAYTSNGPAVRVATPATISDSDSVDFDGGALRVALINNGDFNDRLELRNEGSGPGQVGFAAGVVSVGGVEVGLLSGGIGIDPLVIDFNQEATPATATAVLRNVTFRSTRDISGTLPRTLRIQVSDGDGGQSTAATRTISIQNNPDPFVYTIEADISGSNVPQGQPVEYTISFSKAIDLASVDAGDFSNAGSSTISVGAISQNQPREISVVITPTSTGTLQLRLPASAEVLDSSGVPVLLPATDDDIYAVSAPDVTAPQLTGFANDSVGGTINARLPVIYQLSFNEPISIGGLQGNDFSNAGSSTITVADIVQVNSTLLQLRVNPLDAGTLQLRISGAGITDVAGNALVLPQTDSSVISVQPALDAVFSNSFEED